MALIEPILKALRNEGYTTPTPIQSQAIPVVLEGKDLIGLAQTGTGKTAAFAIPILQRIFNAADKGPKRRIKALVLSPTRELAAQIAESFTNYGRYTGLRNTVIFGGVSSMGQIQDLRNGVDILVATPGRLLDLHSQGQVSLKDLEVFVLDEADHMLDMGFIHDIRKIITLIPQKRQSLFFSATMPAEIKKLAANILTNPVQVAVAPVASTVDTIEQFMFQVQQGDKPALLVHMLNELDMHNALVFTRTKHGADKLVKVLVRAGIKAEAIHGNKSQARRTQALRNFKSGELRVLVATDIAARGIDVEDMSYVFNYEIPNVSETYVHRIGRTGRAGATGVAVAFVNDEERLLMRDIIRLMGRDVEVRPLPANFRKSVADLPPVPVVSFSSEKEEQAKSQDKPVSYPKNYSRKPAFGSNRNRFSTNKR